MVKLLEKPAFTEYLETGNISEKYKIDSKNLVFKSGKKELKFDYLILEIMRNKDRQILYIYVSFENIFSSDMLDIKNVVEIEPDLVEKIEKAKTLSVIFDIDEKLIDKFIAPKESNLEDKETIFDIEDSENEPILLNFKNYRVCDIMF